MRNAKSLDAIKMGPEPDGAAVVLEGNDPSLHDALTWYSFMTEVEDRKRWMIQWARAARSKSLAKQLEALPAWQFTNAAGAMCRLLLNGAKMTPYAAEYIDQKIAAMLPAGTAETAKTAGPAKTAGTAGSAATAAPSAFSLYRAKKKRATATLLETLETIIDSAIAGDAAAVGTAAAAAASAAATTIADRKDLIAAADRYDAQAAAVASERGDPAEAKILTVISSALRQRAGTKKVIRRRRAAKAPVKIAAVTLTAIPSLGIPAAAKPADVIGAKETWAYNVKYRTLAYLPAVDALSVKGKTIRGVDATQARVVRLRKPAEQLAALLRSRTRAERFKAFAQIKAEKKPLKSDTFRLNENTALL